MLSPSQILAIRQRAKSFGRAVASVGGELGTIGENEMIELSRKELTGGRWVTIHPHGDEGDYRRLYIGGDGTIKAGPKAMIGKHIDGTKATHEVREADHPKSPLKKETLVSHSESHIGKVDPDARVGKHSKADLKAVAGLAAQSAKSDGKDRYITPGYSGLSHSTRNDFSQATHRVDSSGNIYKIEKHIPGFTAQTVDPNRQLGMFAKTSKPTASDTIAKMKGNDLESKVDSTDLDGPALRDLKAKSMERVKGKGKAKPVLQPPAGAYATLADFEKDYEPMGRIGIHAMTYSGMSGRFDGTHGQGVSDIMQSVNEDRRHSLRSNPAMMSEANAYTDLRLASSQIERAKADPKVAKMIDRLRGPMAAKFVEMMSPGGELSNRPHMIENRLSTLADMSKPYGRMKATVKLSAPSPYYLSASSTTTDATELSSALPKEFNGAEIHYKWQDAAIAGNWKHPTKGFTLNINNARIDKWVKGIELARSNGVDLPIVKDHKETADSTLGYIYGARQNNGRLELLNGYIGADSLAIAQRNKLSIGIDPNFKDSHGTSYGEAIRHVAVTPIPVIHGQQGFLAASRDGQQEAEYLIPVAKENEMTLTDAQRKEICDVLGVEHVDDDAAISLLTATVTDLQNECLTLSAAKDEATKKITELSAASAPEVVEPSKADPELVKTKIELSAAKGDITKFLADGLNKLIDSEPLLLSREGDGKPAIVLKFLELFDGAKLGAKTVEKTGVQTLSREVPDGEKAPTATVNPYDDTIARLTASAK